MPIRKVKGGYKWGGHGHVYASREGAARQAAAAHANGWQGDEDETKDSKFDELVEKLMRKGYSKAYATKIAGKIAAEKGKTGHEDSRRRVGDRSLHAEMRDRMYYSVQELGKSRKILPNGTLLCQDVPIARTGSQTYGEDEVPIDAVGGRVTVERPPEEVFRDETIASFEAVPVTVEHPNDFVRPENYKQHAVGHVQNVRRGEGLQDDLLIADLVVTDPKAIEYVNTVRPELSAGYEADYDQVARGRGVQRNIVGNHVALVERGRAGPRVAIQDSNHQETAMPNGTLWDRLRRLVRDAEKEREDEDREEETEDEDTEEREEERSKDKKSKDRSRSRDAAFAKLVADAVVAGIRAADKKAKDDEEGEEEERRGDKEEKEDEGTEDTVLEAEEGEVDNSGKTWTGSLTGDSLREIASRAEILVPGIKMPTGDGARAKNAGEQMMRHALKTAYTTDAGRAAIDPFLLGVPVEKLTKDALQGVFVGASALRAQVSNRSVGGAFGAKRKTTDFGAAPPTPAEINRLNREARDKRRAAAR